MENHAQVAFESLFLTLVVISAGIFITGYYLQIHQDTVALFTAKTEVLNQINNTSKETTIDYLKISKSSTGDFNLNIKTTPKLTLDLNSIRDKVKENTTYQKVNINQD
jgi:predicted phage-related endonuclease